MADVVDLAERRFARDAEPGVDACIVLIEEAVLAGVADPLSAAMAIFYGTARYLTAQGCPREVLEQHFAEALRRT